MISEERNERQCHCCYLSDSVNSTPVSVFLPHPPWTSTDPHRVFHGSTLPLSLFSLFPATPSVMGELRDKVMLNGHGKLPFPSCLKLRRKKKLVDDNFHKSESGNHERSCPVHPAPLLSCLIWCASNHIDQACLTEN